MFKKRHEIRRQELMAIVKDSLPIGADLILFEYYPRFFEEDFKIEISCNEIKYVLHTVKGDIYYDEQLYCNDSYHYLEKESTFGKLLDVIKKVVI